jgi:hypothetical protein
MHTLFCNAVVKKIYEKVNDLIEIELATYGRQKMENRPLEEEGNRMGGAWLLDQNSGEKCVYICILFQMK